MSLASRLYQLQVTELQLREQRRRLQETQSRLDHNEDLSAAEASLTAVESRLKAAEKHQRQLEWEVEDLNAKIRGLKDKLYGGTVRNPKELLSLEQDVQSVKKHLSGKEELLLEAMDDTESIQAEATTLRQRVGELRSAWEQERGTLQELKESLEEEVARLAGTRLATREEIGADVSLRYDQLAKSKGLAVAKVEQGRCKGCNLTVPAGLWQKARAGEVVECGSCGRLIYVD
jgi:predicted  nucleic acid-binding Zn-ribbon protein